MSEFPEEGHSYYVAETFTLEGGCRLIDWAAGPFGDPDEARRVRDHIRETEPSRCVHCVHAEAIDYGEANHV